jgi:hypothetical protein
MTQKVEVRHFIRSFFCAAVGGFRVLIFSLLAIQKSIFQALEKKTFEFNSIVPYPFDLKGNLQGVLHAKSAYSRWYL